MKLDNAKIAIIGATGLVGEKILGVMDERGMIPGELRLFASSRSAGNIAKFAGLEIPVNSLSGRGTEDLDIAVIAAGLKVSKAWAPRLAKTGAIVIDKSSAFRRDPDCPLVMPPVNPEAVSDIPKNIIASPNCSTAGFVVAAAPLISRFGAPVRVDIATYQAVSGAGRDAIEVLNNQRKGEPEQGPFPVPIFRNLIPQIGEEDEFGYNEEERKLIAESRRILNLPELDISATAVRVPVDNCHSLAVTFEFAESLKLPEVLAALESAPALRLVKTGEIACPLAACGTDDVLAGRIRISPSNDRVLSMFLVSDNLRRGAATNAVESVELVLERVL